MLRDRIPDTVRHLELREPLFYKHRELTVSLDPVFKNRTARGSKLSCEKQCCRSKSVWKNTCHPILAAAGLKLEVVETQRPQHAFSVSQNAVLKETAALGCVGGDGTMSEILQVFIYMLALVSLAVSVFSLHHLNGNSTVLASSFKQIQMHLVSKITTMALSVAET